MPRAWAVLHKDKDRSPRTRYKAHWLSNWTPWYLESTKAFRNYLGLLYRVGRCFIEVARPLKRLQ